ncbi:Uncharacterised protein g7527 [Pycnogonum litorale]
MQSLSIVIGFLVASTSAVKDVSMDRSDESIVAKISRAFLDGNDADDTGTFLGTTAILIAGFSLLLSILGAVVSLFLRTLLPNTTTSGAVNTSGSGLFAPTTGTVPVIGTPVTAPTTGRKRRSVDLYGHPVWNSMSDVLDWLEDNERKFGKNSKK